VVRPHVQNAAMGYQVALDETPELPKDEPVAPQPATPPPEAPLLAPRTAGRPARAAGRDRGLDDPAAVPRLPAARRGVTVMATAA
jgi:hypothetical protein